MHALGPFANFILAAYTISAVTLIGLTIWVIYNEMNQRQELDKITQYKNDDQS